MTVIDYVMADTLPSGTVRAPADWPLDQAVQILDSIGFVSDDARYTGEGARQTQETGQLSGGWRMKLALSRAILMRADIMLMDEPTNHLDVANVAWVKEYLNSLKNVTAIMVSHDKGLLNDVCTHIIKMDSLKLKTYKGNLTEFVKLVPEAIRYLTIEKSKTAAAELRADKEVVLAAVAKNTHGTCDGQGFVDFALNYAAAELRADKEVVLAAVTHDWEALRCVAAEFKADKEVVLAAVNACTGPAYREHDNTAYSDGTALEFAAVELQADRQVVLAAVVQAGNQMLDGYPVEYMEEYYMDSDDPNWKFPVPLDSPLQSDPIVRRLAGLSDADRALPRELLRLGLYSCLEHAPTMLDEGLTAAMLPALTDGQLQQLGLNMAARIAFAAAVREPEPPEPEPELPAAATNAAPRPPPPLPLQYDPTEFKPAVDFPGGIFSYASSTCGRSATRCGSTAFRPIAR
eukprot:SAG11_NODE_3234_length_2594_cov_1.802405_2_plen_461_part_00